MAILKTEKHYLSLLILNKLCEARAYIKELEIVKDGRNDFSKYDYFTPVLVASVVHQACKEFKLITLFSMKADELGLFGELTLIDLDKGEELIFQMRTDVPSIKATNITQQYGGAETYTQRYLKMSVFEIMDNTIEFDSKNNSKKVRPKLKKGSVAYKKAVIYIKGGGNVKAIQSKYIIEDLDGLMGDVNK